MYLLKNIQWGINNLSLSNGYTHCGDRRFSAQELKYRERFMDA